jgi:hypothetical protein
MYDEKNQMFKLSFRYEHFSETVIEPDMLEHPKVLLNLLLDLVEGFEESEEALKNL